MTGKAVGLENPCVRLLDHDRLVEILRRESLRVMPAVFGLCNVLAEKVVVQMAVDADRNRMVARLPPRVVRRLHDMAVDADPGSWLKQDSPSA